MPHEPSRYDAASKRVFPNNKVERKLLTLFHRSILIAQEAAPSPSGKDNAKDRAVVGIGLLSTPTCRSPEKVSLF